MADALFFRNMHIIWETIDKEVYGTAFYATRSPGVLKGLINFTDSNQEFSNSGIGMAYLNKFINLELELELKFGTQKM